MPGTAANSLEPHLYAPHHTLQPRAQAKRSCILDTAMRYFAQSGYHAARMGDIAATLGIAKASIFQHFGSKDGLFLQVYKRAVQSFPRYLDAPSDVLAAGFFPVLHYWLVRTEQLLRKDWIPYRILLLGNYGAGLRLRHEINRFLVAEDPCGKLAFVRFGLERRELRKDMEMGMILSILDWTLLHFQEALLSTELDPDLLRRQGEMPEKKESQSLQCLALLQRAVGAVPGPTSQPVMNPRKAAPPVLPPNPKHRSVRAPQRTNR